MIKIVAQINNWLTIRTKFGFMDLELLKTVRDYHYFCREWGGGGGGQILNFQNTRDRACDEIRMEIQTENFFRSLISTRLNN
jgi:hypothetical protein